MKMKPSTEKEVLTVSRLNQTAKNVLNNAFGAVWVEGEISNLAAPASGHLYFSLKDEQSQVRCAMFRSRNQTLNFKLEDGMKILVHARVDFYTVRGEFQLVVEHAEPSGIGEIQRRFEMLKQKLDQEGLFNPAKKRPIPPFPDTVGVVTSEKGAALRDILKLFKKRQALFEVIIYPTLVQGKNAPDAIRKAIDTANQRSETDVLIIARGGGSLEDLDCFNDEQLTRTIAASAIPIVSGIGHEIDFTLADFAADLRMPTPTAAAVKVCQDGAELSDRLAASQMRLASIMRHKAKAATLHFQMLKNCLIRLHPQTKFEELAQRFDDLCEQLALAMHDAQASRKALLTNLAERLERSSPLGMLEHSENRLSENRRRLSVAVSQCMIKNTYALKEQQVRLHAKNPLAILKSGYSVTTDEQGKLVRSASQVKPGSAVTIQVEKGRIGAAVKKIISRQ